MPKVKITLTADISDLTCYYPDDPVGITRQNIWMHLHKLLFQDEHWKLTQERFRKLSPNLRKEEEPIVDALIEHYGQNVKLGKRFFDEEGGFDMEILP